MSSRPRTAPRRRLLRDHRYLGRFPGPVAHRRPADNGGGQRPRWGGGDRPPKLPGLASWECCVNAPAAWRRSGLDVSSKADDPVTDALQPVPAAA
jgi:hypothetical protein